MLLDRYVFRLLWTFASFLRILINLMRIRIHLFPFQAYPAPTFHFDVDPDPAAALLWVSTPPFVSVQGPSTAPFWTSTAPDLWLWCGFGSGFWLECGLWSGFGFSLRRRMRIRRLPKMIRIQPTDLHSKKARCLAANAHCSSSSLFDLILRQVYVTCININSKLWGRWL